MPDFGSFRGFGDKLVQGQTPTQLGLIGSFDVAPPLLDLYPSAGAAYSMRLLRNAYTGSAIRVRRSSDNTEQNIGFLFGSLDTSALTSFCGSGNGFVTTWYDQSGNGRDATQTTAGSQPQIVDAGAVILQNSKPALKFDGTDDTFLFTAFTFTAMSLFFAANVLTPRGRILSGGGSGTYLFLGGTAETAFIGFNNNFAIGTNTSYIGNQRLYSLVRDTNGFKFYINSTIDINATQAMGSTNYSRMMSESNINQIVRANMQEMVLYPTDLTSNRTLIESNLNSYYGIY